MISKDKKILIIGLGLIGGSYAEGLTKAGYHVEAITRSQSSIDYALEKGIISCGTIDVKEEYVKQFDILIFSLYPHVFVEWLKNYQSFIKPGAILTDATGVKRWIINEINSFIRDDIEFVSAHPMAGKEVYGVVNADSNIFKGANYIICPTNKSTKEAVEVVKNIGEILEFKHISILSPDEHDEMIGFLSQLTHCIAVSLMTSKSSEYLVDYTGDSFRDLTRIAKINEDMWTELFILNKDKLLNEMNNFIAHFEELKEALENEDREKMKEIMRLSTERRKFFDR